MALKASKPLIIFSHGNSFPASTYGVLFRGLEARGYQVKAIEKFGHDPAYPISSNWPTSRLSRSRLLASQHF